MYNLFAHSLAHPCFLLILSTVYCIAHFISLHILHFLFYYLFPFSFSPIFIYIFSCVMFHCFIAYVIFMFYFIIIIIYFFALSIEQDLSRPTFHYWLYPVWLCMWQIIKNLEPWDRWTVWAPNILCYWVLGWHSLSLGRGLDLTEEHGEIIFFMTCNVVGGSTFQ